MRQLKIVSKNIIGIIFILMINSSCLIGQRPLSDENHAMEILKTSLANPNSHKHVNSVTDSASFIKVIEPILLGKYGKENILSEKSYEIYHFGRYWVGNGTWWKGYAGGVFEIVLDAEKRKIVYVTHAKYYAR
jgi:hypothetical protein